MNRDKMINLAIGGGIALVLIFGWLIGVSPILAQSSTAQATEAAMVTANETSQSRLALLKKQFENMGTLQTQLTGLRKSIPESADIPAFLSELNAQSAASGVSLVSLTVNDAAYVAPPAAAATTPAAGTDASASASPSPSPSASAATTDAAAPAATPATGSGLVAIPVQIIVTGSYAAVMNFSGAVQVGSRLFYIAGLSVSGSTLDPNFTGTLTGNVYVLQSTDTAAATTGAGTTPTPTKTPTPTSTPTPSISGSATPTGSPTPTGTAKP